MANDPGMDWHTAQRGAKILTVKYITTFSETKYNNPVCSLQNHTIQTTQNQQWGENEKGNEQANKY